MRATNLQFRSPCERTAEYRESNVNKVGDNLEYNSPGKNQAGRKSTFSQEQRFQDPKFYCKYTGESVYLGPGSYNDGESFQKYAAKPCSAMMRRPGLLDEDEAKKQCYVMVGDQIKFEPAWCSPAHKKVLEDTGIAYCGKSVTMGLKQKTAEKARDNIKKVRKNRKSAHVSRKMEQPEAMIHQALFKSESNQMLMSSAYRYSKFVKNQQRNIESADNYEAYNYIPQNSRVINTMNNRNSQPEFYNQQNNDYIETKHDQSNISKKSVRTTQASTKMQGAQSYHHSKEKTRRDDSISIDNVFKGLNAQGGADGNNQSQNVLSNNGEVSGGHLKSFKQPRSSYLTHAEQKQGMKGRLMNDNSSTVIFDEHNNTAATAPGQNYNQSDLGRLAQGSKTGQRNHIDSSLSNDFGPGKRSQTAQSHTVRVAKGQSNQFQNPNQSHRVAELSELYNEVQGYQTTKQGNKRTITSCNTSLPKTAVNFHKMKKGLYLNQNRKDLYEFVSKQQKVLSAYNVHLEDPDAFEQIYDRNNEAASMGELNNSMYNVPDAEALTNEQTLNSRGKPLVDAPAVAMKHQALSVKDRMETRDSAGASSVHGAETGVGSAISTTINTHFGQPTRILKNSGTSLKFMRPMTSGFSGGNRYGAPRSHQGALKKLRESRRNSTNYSSCNYLGGQGISQVKQKAKIKRGFTFMNAFKTSADPSGDLSGSRGGSLAGAISAFGEYPGGQRRVGASVSTKAIDGTADVTMALNGQGVYMNVIRESQHTSMKKEKLAAQKQKIMGMSFDGLKRGDITRLNNFISDCQRQGPAFN